jgi:hypothetical protein
VNRLKRSMIVAALSFGVGMRSGQILTRGTVTAHAQAPRPPELVIGSETISVGMAQAAVIAKFSGRYKLLPFDPSGGLLAPTGGVFIMQSDNDVIGSVNFRDGKLINAERDWGAFYSRDGIDRLWTALDAALSQQVPLSTWRSVQIRRTEVETPQIGTRTIDIRFADRTIQLRKGRSEGPPANTHYETYSVSEVVPLPLFP